MFAGAQIGRTRRAGREQALRSLVREYHCAEAFDPQVFFYLRWTQETPEYQPAANHPDPSPPRSSYRAFPRIFHRGDDPCDKSDPAPVKPLSSKSFLISFSLLFLFFKLFYYFLFSIKDDKKHVLLPRDIFPSFFFISTPRNTFPFFIITSIKRKQLVVQRRLRSDGNKRVYCSDFRSNTLA